MKKLIDKIKNIQWTKKNIITLIIVLVLLVAIIVGVCLVVDHNHKEKIKKNSSIDFDSETYKGKKITVEGNKIIIEEENGSKTIETVSTEKDNDMTKTTKEIRDMFTISDVVLNKNAAKMTVEGKLKENSDKYKSAIVTIKFYRNEVLAGSQSSLIENIKKNKNYSFSMNLVGNYSDCTYTVTVDYVK